MRLLLSACIIFSIGIGHLLAVNGGAEKKPTIEQKTASMHAYPGFFNLYWDGEQGRMYLEIDRWDQEFLYVHSLSHGMGSNDVGLDRGQIGASRVVKFLRSGSKVLLLQPNYSYRAVTDNADERRAVKESFAQSVLFGFTVTAQTGDRVLVDASEFYLQDVHNVKGALRRTHQGKYQRDESRSAIYLERTRNFPKNTEVDAILTFVGENPGEYLQQVVPTPQVVSVHEHHSFIALPDANYRPRMFDPRAGYFGIGFKDFSAPLGQPIYKRFISRHRLRKRYPEAPVSEPVEPIVYYLDPGAPEPIRSALMEGASWWNQAFEAIGYKNAFQVRLLPEGADPLDVRYNVIQWVHRATRGWSYGTSVVDPRTGEIIKGHIRLGSQRVRQDFTIAQGLLAPYEEGRPNSDQMQEMALARLRQLAAHEVGHTLGLAHNFAASVFQRASVMDYPHPLIKLDDDGNLDLSEAYAVGIGEWDKVAIAYGYQDFPDTVDEVGALELIIRSSVRQGLIFITDRDARPIGAAHPLASLWDNGEDPVEELQRILTVRKTALSRFSERNIPFGTPMAELEKILVPIYLLHRYQMEAAAKLLGGMYYTYALRGDGQTVVQRVPADKQRAALIALLNTLKPELLEIPPGLIKLIPPLPPGYSRDREYFSSRATPSFDALVAAETAAELSLRLLLNPQRAVRLEDFHGKNREYPGLGEVIDALAETAFRATHRRGYPGQIQQSVQNLVLQHLMKLSVDEEASSQVRAIAFFKLGQIEAQIQRNAARMPEENWRAHYQYLTHQLQRFIQNPVGFRFPEAPQVPMGPPIGNGMW